MDGLRTDFCICGDFGVIGDFGDFDGWDSFEGLVTILILAGDGLGGLGGEVSLWRVMAGGLDGLGGLGGTALTLFFAGEEGGIRVLVLALVLVLEGLDCCLNC